MLTAAASPRCSGNLMMQSIHNGKVHVIQSVCSKTVQEIFQELGEQCRDKGTVPVLITTGADRVLQLNEETKDMSFHEAHQIYLKFDNAQQGNYRLIDGRAPARAAASPRCSGDLILQSIHNGKAYHLQSVCSKTVQEIFQELGDQCRDQRHASMAITTGADRVLRLNEETKNMSFHEAHQSYLKFDNAQQGNYRLIHRPTAELAPEQIETTEKKPTESDLTLPQTNSSNSQSSLSLFGRFKKITLDFLYAIPVYLKKIIDYVKNLFKPSTVKPTQPTQVRFGEARVREFDKKGSPSDVGEIHSRTFERFEN